MVRSEHHSFQSWTECGVW